MEGAFGTIRLGDEAPRTGTIAKCRTLLAVVGPGLIVMVGDNDAGAFGTYAQAGQNYGTSLLWALILLVPVLYVNQEMVLRLGIVAGVRHARLILERFGKFWGAFSVIDLFILNALTIVTERRGRPPTNVPSSPSITRRCAPLCWRRRYRACRTQPQGEGTRRAAAGAS